MSTNKEISHIHLLGSPEENFYALGKKDAQGFSQILDHMTKLCLRSDAASKVFKIALELSREFHPKGSIDIKNQLKAYADGLERPLNEVYFAMLLPEIVAAFNKWTPDLMSIIPGCSSLFVWDAENKGVVHGRVLDYAISGPFESFERSIFYDFTNRYKVYSYSTAGMPFPSLTAMNEKGLTLALHYKHGDYFNLKGDSIFTILYQVVSYCQDVHEVKKYLKEHPSMGYWGIYLSDKSGNVASFDVCGSDIYQEKFDLKEHQYLYFNNRPLIKDKKHSQMQPLGNLDQCKMRFNFVKEKMSHFNNDSKKLDLEILKLLSTPNTKKENTAKDWKLAPLTPSSIQISTFHSGLNQSYFITGVAPKIAHNEIVLTKDIHENPKQKIDKLKSNIDSNLAKGYEKLALSQSEFDLGKIESAYHQLQMSMEYHRDYPEYYIEKFYFTVWQYLYDTDEKDLVYLFDDFVELKDKLPPYLEDHRLLFIQRLAIILSHPLKEDAPYIHNEKLRYYYEKESKMNGLAIKMLRKLTTPRLEILDIIYLY